MFKLTRANLKGLFTCVLTTLAIFALAGDVFAHDTKIARGDISVKNKQVLFDLQLSAQDLGEALHIGQKGNRPDAAVLVASHADIVGRYLDAKIKISMADMACTLAPPTLTVSNDKRELKASLRYDCRAGPGPVLINYRLYDDIDPKHRAMGTATSAGQSQEFFFDRTVTSLDLEHRSRLSVFWNIFKLGVEHILIGYDHLLFLFALIMVKARLLAIVKIITAFTIAHSITLAAAWFGAITPSPRLVEVFIALSIAYVSLENIFGTGKVPRWQTSGAFGLIHGLGFFSVLKDLGLEGAGILTTLVAFNLGVEAGQLAVVALLILPLIWWWKTTTYPMVMNILSAMTLLIALWWTGQRIWM